MDVQLVGCVVPETEESMCSLTILCLWLCDICPDKVLGKAHCCPGWIQGDTEDRTWSQTACIWIRVLPFTRGTYHFSYVLLQILPAIHSPGPLAATPAIPSWAVASATVHAWAPNGFRGKQINSTLSRSPAVSSVPLLCVCWLKTIKCQGIILTTVLAQSRSKCQKNI